jgi:hypothetical protein
VLTGKKERKERKTNEFVHGCAFSKENFWRLVNDVWMVTCALFGYLFVHCRPVPSYGGGN